MRTTFTVVLSLFFAASLLHAEEIARVGAWNIEWLGVPGSRAGSGRNVSQKAADLADYIIASNVDVLGLEEVSRNGAGETNITIAEALNIVKRRTGRTWKHVLFPKPSGDANQRIGVAWNTARATMVGEIFKIPVPSSTPQAGSIWERHPHAVQFRFLGPGNTPKTDVVIVVLHMKSNRSSNPAPVVKREHEARTLVATLPDLRRKFHDSDVIILGDSNILDDQEIAAQVYAGAGFRDLNQEDEGTHIGHGSAPFDRAFVAKNQPELVGDQTVFDLEYLTPNHMTKNQFRKRFSDHFMVVVPVKVLSDDD